MNNEAQHQGLTLASKVTVIRILGIPVFVLVMIYYTLSLKAGDPNEYQRWLALIIFMVIALTDALDGYLARYRNEITHLGRILDPIADKTLLISALILLTRPSVPELQPQFPIWFTLLVISRDVLLVVGAFLINGYAGHVDVLPRFTGKIATTLLMLSIFWALISGRTVIFTILIGSAAFFTAVSGIQYIFDGFRQFDRGAAALNQSTR